MAGPVPHQDTVLPTASTWGWQGRPTTLWGKRGPTQSPVGTQRPLAQSPYAQSGARPRAHIPGPKAGVPGPRPAQHTRSGAQRATGCRLFLNPCKAPPHWAGAPGSSQSLGCLRSLWPRTRGWGDPWGSSEHAPAAAPSPRAARRRRPRPGAPTVRGPQMQARRQLCRPGWGPPAPRLPLPGGTASTPRGHVLQLTKGARPGPAQAQARARARPGPKDAPASAAAPPRPPGHAGAPTGGQSAAPRPGSAPLGHPTGAVGVGVGAGVAGPGGGGAAGAPRGRWGRGGAGRAGAAGRGRRPGRFGSAARGGVGTAVGAREGAGARAAGPGAGGRGLTSDPVHVGGHVRRRAAGRGRGRRAAWKMEARARAGARARRAGGLKGPQPPPPPPRPRRDRGRGRAGEEEEERRRRGRGLCAAVTAARPLPPAAFGPGPPLPRGPPHALPVGSVPAARSGGSRGGLPPPPGASRHPQRPCPPHAPSSPPPGLPPVSRNTSRSWGTSRPTALS